MSWTLISWAATSAERRWEEITIRNVMKSEAGVIGCVRGWNSGVERARFMYEGVEDGVALEGDQRRPQ